MWELNTTRCYVTHRPHPFSHSCRRRIEPSSLYPASKISQCSIKSNMSEPLFWCAPPGRACQSLQQVEPPTLVYNHADWAFIDYLRPRITWGKFSWVWYWRRKAIFSFPCYQLLPTQWTCTFEKEWQETVWGWSLVTNLDTCLLCSAPELWFLYGGLS